MKTLATVFALALAASTFNSLAQNASGGASGGGQRGAQGGNHQQQSPTQLAAHLMGKYDANKDGKLTQDELTQAVEELRQHRPQQPGAGKQSGGAGKGSQGGSSGHPRGSGPNGGQSAAPSPDKVAAQMIEKFASDKTGLTQDELVKAIEAHRANRSQHGPARQGGGHPGGSGGSTSNS
jgi:hypothetical protein